MLVKALRVKSEALEKARSRLELIVDDKVLGRAFLKKKESPECLRTQGS